MVFSLAEATADKSAVGSAEQGTLSVCADQISA